MIYQKKCDLNDKVSFFFKNTKPVKLNLMEFLETGGERGIRTLDTVTRITP